MSDHPVVILGAGASFHTGAPGLKGFLRKALDTAPDKLKDLDAFLRGYFGYAPPEQPCPPLPLVLGVLDIALDRKQGLGSDWDVKRLRKVRGQIEYGIFVVLRGLEDKELYRNLVRWFGDREPTIISMNYDLLADAALIVCGQEKNGEINFPDYGCDIATKAYRDQSPYGKLYKLVGSLHWMHCPACQWLDALFRRDLTPSEARRAFDFTLLGKTYGKTIRSCPRDNCGAPMRPIIVTPTPVQEEHGPHIARVRYSAERALQQADAAIFIGYGMNASDLDLIYLLQRGLSCLPPEKITVVADKYDDVHERYKDLFGPRIKWTGMKFKEWMRQTKPVQDY